MAANERAEMSGVTEGPHAVIVDSVRTPIGRAFKGSLRELRADETAAFIIDALLERNPGVDPASVEEVYLGCGLPQGPQANNVARIAALLSKHLPLETGGVTINRYCASSLQAIRSAANAVVAGQGDVYVAGGVEFVSSYNEATEGARPQDQNPHLHGDEPPLPDAYISMGVTAENVAEKYGVTREQQDAYAKLSQDRAVAAQAAGVFDREIVPVTLPGGDVVSADDGPRPGTTLEKLGTLKPAFREGGTVTAGNACPLNDGAAAALIMSSEKADELGLTPRARIITGATAGNEPELMGVAPIKAIEKVLARAGMTIGDVDVYELNEAFAAQVLPIADAVGFDMDKLNPHGGAIALGHPFGMTGARILTTLLNDLEQRDGTIGLETMCVAQGQGEAMLIERLR
jgi:acetyl-CoA C-acetyltransferase